METRSNQILVGSIVLGLLAALAVFIIWLSQVGDGAEKTYDVFFQQSVEGLAKGSAVTFRGVPGGQIRSINLEPASPQFIRVRITVREEIRCPEQNPQTECPYGYPVIPTRPGALGQLLNTAPELLERVSALTERLTELLSDRNQESLAGILDNMEEISRNLAERSPEIAATLAEARVAIRQAGDAADQIGRLAGSTENLL